MNPVDVLSKEDGLRLNVLMTQAEAVRIDPRGPAVVALAGDRELRVELHPDGREDAYLLAVRRLLASLVIGHPGGFPVFIRRWLQGGQLENLRTADLLKLGEPEAVLAAAASPHVDATVARRAWWAHPEPAVARALLGNPALTDRDARRELATRLVEHLPFEQDEAAAMATVRLVAEPGLVPAEVRLRLWRRGVQRAACLVGFLQAAPDDLPEPPPARALPVAVAEALEAEAGAGDPLAHRLAKALEGPGQGFLAACDAILEEPHHREIISPLLNLLGDWCRVEGGDARRLAGSLPGLAGEIDALVRLGASEEALCYPVFSRSTASGSLLRDKLREVLHPLREAIATLRGVEVPTPGPRRRRRSSATGLPNWG
ncbi:MAG: sulfur reduction protein DsrS [Gammaproteobacteria bacterium]|nr:sulfur reduction protein DsrS [Gammaproteobacteria bacterium]